MKFLLIALLLLIFFKPISSVTTLVVDKLGKQPSSFTTIQAAIDVIPENNIDWFIIEIGEGVFREKVEIKYNQPFIVLKGSGRKVTEIVFDDHNNTAQSSTFTARAHSLVVKHLSIRNDYNRTRVQAVAALLYGDYMYFDDVGFYSYQDTLWDARGLHFFYNCFVEGAVDFIFGDGTSIYEKTAISVIGSGYITAQARDSPQSPSGFVFINCSIVGTAPTLLGRAYGNFSRTIFSHSYFSEALARDRSIPKVLVSPSFSFVFS